jgi:hypothetical protein
MTLVAGLAVGLWLFLPIVVDRNNPREVSALILAGAAIVLGGLASAGPPILLAARRRERAPWGAGKVLWFASGTSAWLLWPPVIVHRVRNPGDGPSATQSEVCFLYGTPLMAVYVTAALVAGGWLSGRRRRRLARSWREQFGLFLGLAWACTGLYVLWLIYRSELGR